MTVNCTQKFRGYTPFGAEEATEIEEGMRAEEITTHTVSEAFDISYETAMDFQKGPGDPPQGTLMNCMVTTSGLMKM